MPAIIFELWDMFWNVHYWPKIVWWLDVIGSLAYVTQSMVDSYKGHRITGSLASQSKAVFGQSQIVIPVTDCDPSHRLWSQPQIKVWHLLDWPPLGPWWTCLSTMDSVVCGWTLMSGVRSHAVHLRSHDMHLRMRVSLWYLLEATSCRIWSDIWLRLCSLILRPLPFSLVLKTVYVIPRDHNHSVWEWGHVYLECSIATCRLLLFSLESRV